VKPPKISSNLPNKGFVLCSRGDIEPKHAKIPIKKGWQKNLNLIKEAAETHLGKGFNVGLLCGEPNDIVVLDCDRAELAEEALKSLPETYTQKSANRGLPQMFFKILGFRSNINILSKDGDPKNSYGQVLADRKQCIIAPSTIKKGGGIIHYEVVKDVPVTEITAEQLLAVVNNFPNTLQKKQEIQPSQDQGSSDISSIPIRQVIDLPGFTKSGDELYGAHPTHGSEGGKNFWVG